MGKESGKVVKRVMEEVAELGIQVMEEVEVLSLLVQSHSPAL